MSVPAQITVLLALTANLFDPVPLDQMTNAEHAVQEAAASIPTEVNARFETAAKLNDEDRKTVIEIARKALIRFQPQPEVKPEAKPETKAEAKSDGASKPQTKPESELKPVPATEPKPKPETEPVVAALKEKP